MEVASGPTAPTQIALPIILNNIALVNVWNVAGATAHLKQTKFPPAMRAARRTTTEIPMGHNIALARSRSDRVHKE